MNITIKDLNQICKVLNNRLGIHGSSGTAFYIDKDAGGYRLFQANGKEYGPRADRKTVYNYISGMIDGLELTARYENEGKGVG